MAFPFEDNLSAELIEEIQMMADAAEIGVEEMFEEDNEPPEDDMVRPIEGCFEASGTAVHRNLDGAQYWMKMISYSLKYPTVMAPGVRQSPLPEHTYKSARFLIMQMPDEILELECPPTGLQQKHLVKSPKVIAITVSVRSDSLISLVFRASSVLRD